VRFTFETEVETFRGAHSLSGGRARTLIVDRRERSGGDGLGPNGGEPLYLATAGCVSNDLFREARVQGIELVSVSVRVRGEFSGAPRV
jgi:uncharacterized OsmC-like protein